MICGIDPGVKTGIAFYDGKKFIWTGTCDIIVAMGKVLDFRFQCGGIHVNIEDPNLRKWYGTNADAKRQGAGSIKRDYSVWVSFFKFNAIPFTPYAPKSIGCIPASVARKMTGKGRTSEHERDAMMLALKRPL